MRILHRYNLWYFLFELQTNSPGSTTFDPVVQKDTGTATMKWVLGDGNIKYGWNISHTYADSSVKTVKVYTRRKDWANFTGFNLATDNIYGELDLQWLSYGNNLQIILDTNPELSSIVMPSGFTGDINMILINYCDILNGTLDLSAFNTFDGGATIAVTHNPLLDAITFASSISGAISQLNLNTNHSITSLDISKFLTFTSTGYINVSTNNLLATNLFQPVGIT